VGGVRHQVQKVLLHLSRARFATKEVIIWCRRVPGYVPAAKVAGVCRPETDFGDLALSAPVSAQGGDESGGFMRGMTYGGS
jgi:hypothetical protein